MLLRVVWSIRERKVGPQCHTAGPNVSHATCLVLASCDGVWRREESAAKVSFISFFFSYLLTPLIT